jgi:Zinc knuckle
VKNTPVGQPTGGSQFSGTERRCFRCKKTGHLMRDCKVKVEQGSSHKLNVHHVQADRHDAVDTPCIGVGAEVAKTAEAYSMADTALVSQTNIEGVL